MGNASGADVAPNPQASCLSGGYALQIDQVFQKTGSYTIGRTAWMPRSRPEYDRFRGSHGGMSMSRVTQRLHGEARAIAPLSLSGQTLAGTASMAMQAEEHIRHAGQSCSSHRAFAVTWKFEGTISDQCALDLNVVREWSGGASDGRVCTIDVLGRFTGVYPSITEGWRVSLTAEHGASAKREAGNFAVKDVTMLTLIRTPQLQ